MTQPSSAIDALPVLLRREIEARVLAPFVDALAAEFGRERVIEILRSTIVAIAREQGEALAARQGRRDLADFAEATAAWTKEDALAIDVLEHTSERYHFNVTRCRYAEMYRALGIPELGALLSCNRDAALIEGYHPGVQLTRSTTLMQGGSCCDFRYELIQGSPSTNVPGVKS